MRPSKSAITWPSAEEVRALLDYDPISGLLKWRVNRRGGRAKVGSVAGSVASDGYLIITVRQRGYGAHRLAWLHSYGSWPCGQIDHIDGDRRNNRLGNLRDVTVSVNAQNRRKAPSTNRFTGLLGVSFGTKTRWKAKIVLNGKDHNLGYYKTPEEAHEAYLSAKRALHEGCTI